MIWSNDDYGISTDRDLLDFAVIHGFLTESYWSPGIARAAVERAARHSMPFGVYRLAGEDRPAQVGYARVLTDFVRFAYVLDVFVVEAHRGRGLAARLTEAMVTHPELSGVAGWMLSTRGVHGLYAKFGFEAVSDPSRLMRRARPADLR